MYLPRYINQYQDIKLRKSQNRMEKSSHFTIFRNTLSIVSLTEMVPEGRRPHAVAHPRATKIGVMAMRRNRSAVCQAVGILRERSRLAFGLLMTQLQEWDEGSTLQLGRDCAGAPMHCDQ